MASPAGPVRKSLSAHRDFRLLWGGQSVSSFGTQISALAVPLVAVLTLHGSPVQVAAVASVENLPSLLFGLVAGVWVDRLDCRRLMVITDLARCAALLAIPVLHAVGELNFPLLYMIIFVVGVLSLLYDLAYQSMLPTMLPADDLVDANGRLQASQSVAAGAGPLAGGGLVQLITAPLAVLADAGTYLVSAILALLMRDVPARPPAPRQAFRSELAVGVRAVLSDQRQARLTGTALTSNFFGAAVHALLVLYAVRQLHLSALAIGLAFAWGAVGAVIAMLALPRLGRRLSPLNSVLAGLVVSALGYLLMLTLAPGASYGAAVVLLSVSSLLSSTGMVIVGARAMAWRQEITPPATLARVISVTHTLAYGAVPLGALLAGALAEATSLRTALIAGTLGMLAAGLWLVGIPRARPVAEPARPEPDTRTREA